MTFSSFTALLLLTCVCHNVTHAENNSSSSNSSGLRFFMLGASTHSLTQCDWGKSANNYGLSPIMLRGAQKSFNQRAIAHAMAVYASNYTDPSCSFVVALGDNFYNDGVESSTDSRWQYLWSGVYHGVYPVLSIPWYPVFGNHDYGYGATGVAAQIAGPELSEGEVRLWDMPSTNYSKSFSVGNGAILTIVFIDSTTLAPSANKCCNENGGVSTSEQEERITNQLEHVDAMLAEAYDRSEWLLVAGHYPVYSSGEHLDSSELISYLEPLLQKYNVHAYFCGHDHISEHLQKDNIEYFVSGAGSMEDVLGSTASAAELLWYGVGYSAFSVVHATSEVLEVSFIDLNNTLVYAYNLTEPHVAVKAVSTDPSGVPSQMPSNSADDVDVEVYTSIFLYLTIGAAALTAFLGFIFVSQSIGSRGVPRDYSRRKVLESVTGPVHRSADMHYSALN